MLSARAGADLPTVSRIGTLERLPRGRGSGPLGGDYRPGVSPRLIDIGYLTKRIEGVLQADCPREFEGVEATAFHERDAVPGDVADGADFTAESVALAKPAGLSVGPAFGETSEFERHQPDGLQILEDLVELIAGSKAHAHRGAAATQLGLVKPPIREANDDGVGSRGAMCIGQCAFRHMPPVTLADASVADDFLSPAP